MNNKITDFFPLRLTSVGRSLVNRANDGETLTFLYAVLGDGKAKKEEIDNLKQIKSAKLTVPIAKVEYPKADQTRLQFRINNSKVEETFAFSELGIMARIGDGEPVLYAYALAKPDCVHNIYNKNCPLQERIINVDMVISNSENIKALLNLSIISATKEDIANHNNDKNAHPIIQTELKRLDDVKADKKELEAIQQSTQQDGQTIMSYMQDIQQSITNETQFLQSNIDDIRAKQDRDFATKYELLEKEDKGVAAGLDKKLKENIYKDGVMVNDLSDARDKLFQIQNQNNNNPSITGSSSVTDARKALYGLAPSRYTPDTRDAGLVPNNNTYSIVSTQCVKSTTDFAQISIDSGDNFYYRYVNNSRAKLGDNRWQQLAKMSDFASNKSRKGWVRMPSGIIIQWGEGEASVKSQHKGDTALYKYKDNSFAIRFNSVFTIATSNGDFDRRPNINENYTANSIAQTKIANLTTTGFYSLGTAPFKWIAIGC